MKQEEEKPWLGRLHPTSATRRAKQLHSLPLPIWSSFQANNFLLSIPLPLPHADLPSVVMLLTIFRQ